MTALKISNKDARRLWLETNGLSTTPNGPLDLLPLIKSLGFVQLDSIQVVARAHHHILWSRNQSYREPMLDQALSQDRLIFEHFTHDASVVPMDFLPMWQRQFVRMKAKTERSSWYGKHLNADLLASVTQRVAEDGPVSSHDFDTKVQGDREMWKRPPHKIALDYLWYCGVLATSHRDGFTKYYDLAERVFPAELRKQQMGDLDQIDWLCAASLDRIGFGTLGEVRKFWDATEVKDINDWAARHPTAFVRVEVQAADGIWSHAIASPDILQRLETVTAPTSRLRILNPFDPAIRDRTRLKRLFGFDYTVEMFVPAAKRKWGYYVFPLLEGSRFVGRIEVKADRKRGALDVLNLWFEQGVEKTSARMNKLDAELARLGSFVGVRDIEWIGHR